MGELAIVRGGSAGSSTRAGAKAEGDGGGRKEACGMQGKGVGPFEFVGQVLGTHSRAKSRNVERRAAASAHCRQIAPGDNRKIQLLTKVEADAHNGVKRKLLGEEGDACDFTQMFHSRLKGFYRAR